MTKGASSAAQNSTGFGKDWLAPAPAKLTASRIAGFVAQSPVDRSSSRENATISIVAADCPVACARGAHTDGLPGSGQKIPAAALCRRGRPGPLYAHSAECAGAEPHRARLHLLWASRHRENGWREATIAIEGLRDDSSRCLIGWYRKTNLHTLTGTGMQQTRQCREQCRCGQISLRAEFYFRLSRQRSGSASPGGRQRPSWRSRRKGPCHCGRILSSPVRLPIPTDGRGPERRNKPRQPTEGRGSLIRPQVRELED